MSLNDHRSQTCESTSDAPITSDSSFSSTDMTDYFERIDDKEDSVDAEVEKAVLLRLDTAKGNYQASRAKLFMHQPSTRAHVALTPAANDRLSMHEVKTNNTRKNLYLTPEIDEFISRLSQYVNCKTYFHDHPNY